MRQASGMLYQSIKSSYVNQLVCAVGGVLVFIAKSEWRGGEQKKLEFCKVDMPSSSRAVATYYILILITILLLISI